MAPANPRSCDASCTQHKRTERSTNDRAHGPTQTLANEAMTPKTHLHYNVDANGSGPPQTRRSNPKQKADPHNKSVPGSGAPRALPPPPCRNSAASGRIRRCSRGPLCAPASLARRRACFRNFLLLLCPFIALMRINHNKNYGVEIQAPCFHKPADCTSLPASTTRVRPINASMPTYNLPQPP